MEKILIVDDDADIIEVVKVRLISEGYNVLVASNGKEALHMLEEETPDLIILDVMMPDMDGFETCKRIKSRKDKGYLPIIMLTVSDTPDEKVKGLDLGASDYITKPYEADEFMARIRAGLRAKREYDRILQMAEKDSLTGLYNRRSLDVRLSEEFSRAQRYTREFSIIMLDIDHFKAVNDTYGHQMGDVVLKQVADLIEKSLRKSDVPYRYGGEEFVILATETGIAGAKMCAERIRMSCHENSFGEEKQPVSIAMSGGISCYPQSSVENAEELLRKADSAMYEAKAAGGNCISIN